MTSTGRAGLTLLLQAMCRLAPPDRREVVLPTYTCYSVAASVVKAGLTPRLVDIDPETLDFDHAELGRTDFRRVLAIVATNLYGLPNDLPALSSLARRHGVFLIDDAAQAMGASVGGRPCGSWGDAGLFSFDKGKNVSAIDGGVVVTNSDAVAGALRAAMAGLSGPGAAASAMHVLKALAYFILLRPSLYGIPTRIPALSLGTTAFTTDYPLALADPRLVALGLVMMDRLDEFTRVRVATAKALIDGLRGASGIQQIRPAAGARVAYLRLPILVARAGERAAMIDALTAAGIGATVSYPSALVDVPELRTHLANPDIRAAGGRAVAARLITLPTHPFVASHDVERTVAIIQERTQTACAA